MISGKIFKKATAIVATAAMLLITAVPAFAADPDITAGQETTQGGYTYTAPKTTMEIDSNIITATAHRAASPVLGIMGLNAVCGFGMINGGAPSDLADAQTRAALGIWGTSINSNPDPYYWNYFYNFYAAENGLTSSDDALVNDNVAASPMKADTTLKDEYGGISVSLSKRPEIVIGCASSNNSTDTNGYDSQLETIHSFSKDSGYYQDGDENYAPELVSYQTTTIKEMIESVYRIAEAVKAVEKETGKTTRYEDVNVIASNYEDYVYGIISYVREELDAKGLDQKKIAVITEINDDGTYKIADNYSRSSTSLVRAYEYAMTVTTNICDTYGTTVTKNQLLTADAILTFNNSNITQEALQTSLGTSTYDGIIISNTPSSLYGVTMNSVENAMGYAYTIGSLYSDTIDIDPVDLCAYFYEVFCHVTDKSGLQTVIQTNFAETILPEGVNGTLSNSYDSDDIYDKIQLGKAYYAANTDEFDDVECEKIGLDAWGQHSDEVVRYAVGVTNSTSSDSVSSIGGMYKVGKTVSLEAESLSGYTFSKWEVVSGDVTLSDATSSKITFTMPSNEVQLKAVYTTKTASGGTGNTSTDTDTNNGTTGGDNDTNQSGSTNFTDVDSNAYYADAVAWAVENGITSGTSATTFSPNASCTRAQIVTFLWRAAGSPEPSGTSNSFTDVSSSDYYYKAVLWAIEKGITNGTSAGKFSPNTTVSRAQTVTFLDRYAGSPSTAGGSTFGDVPSDAYYADAVAWAVQNGITTGTSSTTFSPSADCTRAQIVTFIKRYADK